MDVVFEILTPGGEDVLRDLMWRRWKAVEEEPWGAWCDGSTYETSCGNRWHIGGGRLSYSGSRHGFLSFTGIQGDSEVYSALVEFAEPEVFGVEPVLPDQPVMVVWVNTEVGTLKRYFGALCGMGLMGEPVCAEIDSDLWGIVLRPVRYETSTPREWGLRYCDYVLRVSDFGLAKGVAWLVRVKYAFPSNGAMPEVIVEPSNGRPYYLVVPYKDVYKGEGEEA